MKKNWKGVFLCLLLAVFLPSCGSPSVKETINKLIGKSTATSYTLDVSEGKTETEKTLIVKYNNLVEYLMSATKKQKEGHTMTTQETLTFYHLRNDFTDFLIDNQYNISKELTDKIYDRLLTQVKNLDFEEYETNIPSTNYIGQKVPIITKVDLNDYLGDPGDGTDWNYTEIGSETEEYLENLGIYWDSEEQSWVREIVIE